MELGLKNNKKGFSMVQALVAAAITSVVSLGVVSMMEQSRKVQRRAQLMSTLNDLKARIETNLRDQTAFNNTINANTTAPFAQIKTSAVVTENGLSAPVKFIMYDPAGVAWDMLGTTASDAGLHNGFSEKGTPCSNFSPTLGSGSDDCPISYRFLVSADCPRGTDTTCKDPQLTLVARLVFNPSTNGSSVLNSWRNLIQQVPGSSLVNAAEKFDVLVKRTATSISKSFFISASVDPTLGGGPVPCTNGWGTNTGGGACSTSFAVHPLTVASGTVGAGWTIESDPNSLVTVSAAAGTFTFSTSGYYKCIVQAKIFSTNAVFQLYNSTTSSFVPGTGTAVAGQYAESLGRFEVAFNATAGNAYKLYHKCDTSDTVLKSCALGFAKTGYANADENRLVSVMCDRVDVAY